MGRFSAGLLGPVGRFSAGELGAVSEGSESEGCELSSELLRGDLSI